MTHQKPLDPRIVTFGCRMNTYESEVMRDHARAAGLNDAIIVNTCAVTKEAERQARQAVRKLRRENPHAKIIVTGCAVQVDTDRWSGMPEVDRVLGNAEKLKAESYAPGLNQQILVDDIMTVRETAEHLLAGFEGHTRAFVQVQQGCDHRCTFCIIPYARGPNRSVPMGRITEQVRALVENGYREVVLTGVDITAYGADLPGAPPLGQMVRRLLANVPELPRLRLTSLDPVEVDDDLLELIGREPRLMPHFHLSAQAGDDLILKRMKRRHLRADVIALAERIRALRPDAVLGADFITGFPTETGAMFENTLRLVEEAGLTHLHVFPYSARPGTPAARIPGLPGEVVKARAGVLRDLGRRVFAGYCASRVGAEARVLVEEPGKGHCEHYVPVRLPETAPVGAVVTVRVTETDGETLTAEVAA